MAHHLRQGGAEVAFFVKQKHAAEARAGFALYPLKFGRRQPRLQRLEGVPVFTDWSDAGKETWDWVVLALPPPALRAPGFAEGLAKVAAGKTQVVAMMLGLRDAEWLEQAIGPGRLSSGAINLLSFTVPLGWLKPEQPGTAYFLPPGPTFGLSGLDPAALGELAQVCRRGGVAASVSAQSGARLPDAVLFALVSALELVGWKFSGLAGGKALRLGLDAAGEREAIKEASGAGPNPWALKLIAPWMLRLVLAIVRAMAPLPLEDFLRVHFTKVSLQFEEERQRLIAEAGARSVAAPRLVELDVALRDRERLGASTPAR